MKRHRVIFLIEKEMCRKPSSFEDQDPSARALRIVEVLEKAGAINLNNGSAKRKLGC